MVAPRAVNLKVAPGDAFLMKTGFFQHANRGGIIQEASGFDAMKSKGVESIINQAADGLSHISLSGMGFAHPISKIAGLRYAAANMDERKTANQGAVALSENEKCMAYTFASFMLVAIQSETIGAAAMRI